jgi:hypothetical protein
MTWKAEQATQESVQLYLQHYRNLRWITSGTLPPDDGTADNMIATFGTILQYAGGEPMDLPPAVLTNEIQATCTWIDFSCGRPVGINSGPLENMCVSWDLISVGLWRSLLDQGAEVQCLSTWEWGLFVKVPFGVICWLKSQRYIVERDDGFTWHIQYLCNSSYYYVRKTTYAPASKVLMSSSSGL